MHNKCIVNALLEYVALLCIYVVGYYTATYIHTYVYAALIKH